MARKTIFITGAGSGIGEATARIFEEEGWFVGLFDIDEEKIKKLASEFGEENCCYKKCDISNEQEVKEAFDFYSTKTNNKLDLLFANAGIIFQGDFEKFSLSNYKKLIEINNFGTLNTIYQGLAMLKKTNNSKVVITSSASGMFGMPTFAVYSSTKAFLKSLTEALSTEFEKFDISIHNIMPTFVDTKMMDDIDKKHKPLVTSEDVGEVVFKISRGSKKRHHLVGKNLNAMYLMSRLLPTKGFENVIKKTILDVDKNNEK